MRTASLALALAGVVFVGSAFAASSPVTGNLNVSATVAASCLVVGPNTMNFGAYDPVDVHAASNLDVDGQINIRCTKGTLAHVQLAQGANPAAGSSCLNPLRQMSDGGTERLAYGLYTSTGRTTQWGCDVTNERTFSAVASNAAFNMVVFGRVPPAQNVAAGSYTDTVAINVTF
jgi:spore coat protein U-like protein